MKYSLIEQSLFVTAILKKECGQSGFLTGNQNNLRYVD